MASAFETALTGVQDDITDRVGEATPFMIGIAAILLVYKVTKRLVRSVV